MQALSFSASVAQVAVSAAAPKRTVQAKATPVVAAAGRREALKLAASTVLLAASPDLAASVAQDYQIIDDRKAKKNGFDLIYEVRHSRGERPARPPPPWIKSSRIRYPCPREASAARAWGLVSFLRGRRCGASASAIAPASGRARSHAIHLSQGEKSCRRSNLHQQPPSTRQTVPTCVVQTLAPSLYRGYRQAPPDPGS